MTTAEPLGVVRRGPPRKSVLRWARFRIAASTGSMGVHVSKVPAGPLPNEMYARMREFERCIATVGADKQATVCDHGQDYTRFWRAIGPTSAFTATDASDRVVGIAASASVRLRLPGGGLRRANYFTHLKVLPECRFGPALPLIASRMFWVIVRTGWSAFGLVSDSVGFSPERVSRGLGMPAFREWGRVRLVGFSCAGANPADKALIRDAAEPAVRKRFLELSKRFITSEGGQPALRSAQTPRWVMLEDGSACGCIEDTNLARRWISPDGTMVSQTNLSFFGWRDPAAAGRLIRACLAVGAQAGVPRVRIVVDESVADAIIEAVGAEPVLSMPWVVRGFSCWGMPRAPWALHPTEG